MKNETIIGQTVTYVKKTLEEAEAGHDWWHIYRVWKMAQHIGKESGADMLVTELGALLHDIADFKFNQGDEEIGVKTSEDFLNGLVLDKNVIEQVSQIVKNVSFKGEKHEQPVKFLELDVVQDADRLDAIGAIGIARVFTYGGYKGKPLYDPSFKPSLGMSKEEYILASQQQAPSINHFYEKLLLLKDLMNTEVGRKVAQGRHSYMEKYLENFYAEWEGEK